MSTTGDVVPLENIAASNWQGFEQQQQTTNELFLFGEYWPETNFVSTVRPPSDQHNVLTTFEPHVPTVNVNADSSTQMLINELPTVTVSAAQDEPSQTLALTDAQVLHFLDNNGNVPTNVEFLHSLYLFVQSRLMGFAQRNNIPNPNVDEFIDYYFYLIISGDYDLLRTLL